MIAVVPFTPQYAKTPCDLHGARSKWRPNERSRKFEVNLALQKSKTFFQAWFFML